MIQFEHISKTFYKEKLKVAALNNINLEVNKGEITGIIGPNGAGKSTLLKLLYSAIIPTSGSIFINGEELHANKSILKSIGICTETGTGFYNKLTGWENLKFYGSFYGLKQCEIHSRINELEAIFNLKDNLNTYYQYYSSGSKKRIALMRALLHNPAILLLDEITDNLDPLFRESLILYLKELCLREQKTIIFASQRIEEVKNLCSCVIILNKGALIQKIDLKSDSKKDLMQIYKNSLGI